MPRSRLPAMLELCIGLAAGAAVTAWTVPGVADEPVRPPQYDPNAYPPSGTGSSLFVVGAAVTASWYGLALSSALIWPEAAGADDLRIPIAGPFMALADTGCDDDDPDCSLLWPVIRAILIGVNGIGQVGGLAVMGEALFLPTAPRPSPAKEQRSAGAATVHGVELRPVPFALGRSGLGLGVMGRF